MWSHIRNSRKYSSSLTLFILVFLCLILWFAPVTISFGKGKIVVGKIVKVKDGDTVVISPLDGGQFFTCRLYGIDAPETPKYTRRGRLRKPGQPYGKEASRELKRLILGKTATVILTGAKTYNREVCIIKYNGIEINLEMVKRGYAWAYRRYLKRPYASEYINAERKARENRLGLWKQKNPVPPWEFRRLFR
ncbi:MAG: thermonuclease family protein [Nitrospirae bacterium]|nr:thermonuclease family protein [Nitrospirota bacterium]